MMDEYDKCRFCKCYDNYDGCVSWNCYEKSDYRPDKQRIIEKAKEKGLSISDVIVLIELED